MKSRIATSVAAFTLVLATLGAAPALATGAEGGTSPVFTIGPGHTFIADVPGAASTLVRTSKGISVTLTTTGLPAGHAVTVWALIFNNPSACGAGGCHEMNGDLSVPAVQGSVFHVTGHVVGGQGSFAGFVPVGDMADAFVGPGLLDPYGAEIHLIVPTTVLPGQVRSSRSSSTTSRLVSATSPARTSRNRFTSHTRRTTAARTRPGKGQRPRRRSSRHR